jgi:hypothetical protein
MDRQYFASEPAEANGFTLGGITWTLVGGIAATEKGSLGDAFAAPLGMGVGPNGTTYMSVEGGGTEMATWARDNPQTSLGIYWGSIDGQPGNINSLNISMGAFTLTGTQLATMFGANDGGSQFNPNGNQLVTITGLAPFTEATFHSTANAFEFTIGSVPEPSTRAMMVLGFAGLGYAAVRRGSKDRTALAI